MSILDAVREKYETPKARTDKTDKTTLRGSETPKARTDKTDKKGFVSFGSPMNRHTEIFSDGELRRLAGVDWPEIIADPAQLAALKAAAETASAIRRGEVPPHYTAQTECRHCGSVPVFPGLPATVEGCPWCMVRVSVGSMPRAPA